MNTVYESLRTLLRNKELEIKKLEKEIEALRIVLPIVAEAADAAEAAPTFDAPLSATESPRPKPSLSGPDFENVMAQVKSSQPSNGPSVVPRPPAPAASDSSKTRTTWP